MEEDDTAPQPASESAFRSGLIFGAILGAAQVFGVIVEWLTAMYTQADLTHPEATPSNIVTVLFIRGMASALFFSVFFLALLALTFVAGMSTARKTGMVGLGAFAGLLAGVLSALLGSLVNLVASFTLLAPYNYVSAYGGTDQGQALGSLVSAATFWLIVRVLLYGGFGAGLGALGGLAGRSSYQRANPPWHPPLFYSYAYPYAPWPYPMAPYPSAGPQYPAPPYPGQQPPTTPDSYPPQNPPQ